ncbi:hypothetical protein GGS23DRAFT_567268 [Durotheca rogersii]|uniref:uncharacterized protein n=1 Tax=Durotheca rogersii TaxID=419775 RepID=UPI00222005E8|nr:uncharacterized protein GGS23DRAFT_567268 [Durotheca rogersii]KAI5863485.1 hypothetical protein GGS23DRAFT_567268 [Durotheca rogersii]
MDSAMLRHSMVAEEITAGTTSETDKPGTGADHGWSVHAAADTATGFYPSGHSLDAKTMEEDDPIPSVTSDISPRRVGRPRATLLHQPNQQIGTETRDTPITFGTPASPAPSTSRIAVHIRSLPVTPLSYIRRDNRSASRSLRVPQSGAESSPIRRGALLSVGGTADLTRKRGRPKGWKPKLSYAELKGDASAAVSRSRRDKKPVVQPEPKRRGRPPRPLEPTARERYLRTDAKYVSFKCEWKEASGRTCPAELQNMKTLREHVQVIHGDADPLVCRLGKCAARDPAVRFEADEEFEEHVEEKHFRALMWYLGEGCQNDSAPTAGSGSEALPAYLFDKDGNQVTPSVAGQRLEDEQQHRERRRKLKRLLLQAEENAPSEEEYIRQTLGMV